MIGRPGLSRHDPRRTALTVLSTALGGGPSSRLFQQVREQRGLAYSVYSTLAGYSDAGTVAVYAGCAPDRLDEVATVIRGILDEVAAHGLTPAEVARAQGNLRGGLVLGLEDTSSRMNRLGRSEIDYGRQRTVARAWTASARSPSSRCASWPASCCPDRSPPPWSGPTTAWPTCRRRCGRSRPERGVATARCWTPPGRASRPGHPGPAWEHRRVAVETLVAGALIALGIVGVLVPVLPGLLLVLVGVAVWAVPRNDHIGWIVLGAAVLIVVLGSVAKYLVPGRRLRDAGVPTSTLALGGVLGVIGFFVIPVVGLFVGFVLGIYASELGRLRRQVAGLAGDQAGAGRGGVEHPHRAGHRAARGDGVDRGLGPGLTGVHTRTCVR